MLNENNSVTLTGSKDYLSADFSRLQRVLGRYCDDGDRSGLEHFLSDRFKDVTNLTLEDNYPHAPVLVSCGDLSVNGVNHQTVLVKGKLTVRRPDRHSSFEDYSTINKSNIVASVIELVPREEHAIYENGYDPKSLEIKRSGIATQNLKVDHPGVVSDERKEDKTCLLRPDGRTFNEVNTYSKTLDEQPGAAPSADRSVAR